MSKKMDDDGNTKKQKTISFSVDEPHSIVDEVFSWVPCELTRELLVKRSSTAEKISTPKMQTRSLANSPGRKESAQSNTVNYSPMTLSRAAVKSMGDPSLPQTN